MNYFVSLHPNGNQVHKEGRDMECVVARRRHPAGSGVRHHLPGVGVPQRQRLGPGGRHPLPLRYARLLHRLHTLPRPAHLPPLHDGRNGGATLQVEGAAPPLGPRRHLLAHRRQLLAADTGGAAHPGLLGLESLCLRLDVRHSGHHRQLRPTRTWKRSASWAWVCQYL